MTVGVQLTDNSKCASFFGGKPALIKILPQKIAEKGLLKSRIYDTRAPSKLKNVLVSRLFKQIWICNRNSIIDN